MAESAASRSPVAFTIFSDQLFHGVAALFEGDYHVGIEDQSHAGEISVERGRGSMFLGETQRLGKQPHMPLRWTTATGSLPLSITTSAPALT